jgi:cytidylate kinase
MIDEPGVILITGMMAVGKSSVAQALSERLSKSVHLRGDVFRRMTVSGRAEMTVLLSAEAERQLWLRYRLAAAAADRYVEAGFTHRDGGPHSRTSAAGIGVSLAQSTKG